MESHNTYTLYDDPFHFYFAMLEDIEKAESYIIIEVYRFNIDDVGRRFREALLRKAREGVRVMLLLDSWGTSNSGGFFNELRAAGVQIRFFEKIRFSVDFFTKGHRRNHRKIFIIDGRICYIGSANISGYSLTWREMVMRIQNHALVALFEKTFHESWKQHNLYDHKKWSQRPILRLDDFEIVRDRPSIYKQQIKKKFEDLIHGATEEVTIETPYFLPGFKLRKELMDAASRRGVDVKVIMPQNSDVRLVDLLRSKYLGLMHKNGVQFYFYQPGNLHAKCMMIDGKIFAIGSTNFDYRSFRYMHEVVLIGLDESIIGQLKNHIQASLRESIPFDYRSWERRPRLQRLFEWLLVPFRHML
jgi:cardiolipin synthase A/B